MDITLIGILAALLYVASAGLLLRRLTHGGVPGQWLALTPALAAVAAHGIALYHGLFVAGGLNLGFFIASSLGTWLVALLLLLAVAARPLANVGIALFPLAAVGALLPLAAPAPAHLLHDAAWQLTAHILLSLVAYSLFAIAAVQAALLAIQDNHLRNRHPGGFIRALPPLATMENLLFQLISLGFFVLTLALFSGAVFVEDMFAQHLVHKTFFSLLSWLVFAVLLWGRRHWGWRGRKAIRWTLGGFAMLVLAYTGSQLVLQLVLHRA